MEKDEVFLPWTRSGLGLPAEHEQVSAQTAESDDDSHSHSHSHGHGKAESTFEALDELFEETPIRNLFWMLVQQLLGFPLYLFNNASGQDFGRWTNRKLGFIAASSQKIYYMLRQLFFPTDFDPNAPIFDKRHFWQIVLSDIGIIANITTLVLWSHYRSTGEMMRYFFIPYLVVNHHLIIITYTQVSPRSF
jgi:omega-6 fatty acid desaturase (delta-12 desaturase)